MTTGPRDTTGPAVPAAPVEPSSGHPASAEELRTEAYTMAFYVSVCLVAALTAVSSAEDGQVLALVWGTTIGLSLAHLFAFHLAKAIAAPDPDHREVVRLARAQLFGAAVVGVIASVPTLVWGSPGDREAALAAMAVFLGGSAYLLARGRGAGRPRAVVFALAVLAVALVVAMVKNELLGH